MPRPSSFPDLPVLDASTLFFGIDTSPDPVAPAEDPPYRLAIADASPLLAQQPQPYPYPWGGAPPHILTCTAANTTPPASDASGSTIYINPYSTGPLWLPNGSLWLRAFPAGQSLSAASLLAGNLYDLLGAYDAGSLALSWSSPWGTDTTRGFTFTNTNGVFVLDSDPTKILLGTVWVDTNGTLREGPSQPHIDTASFSTRRTISRQQYTGADYTYSSSTQRALGGDSGSVLTIVSSLPKHCTLTWTTKVKSNSTFSSCVVHYYLTRDGSDINYAPCSPLDAQSVTLANSTVHQPGKRDYQITEKTTGGTSYVYGSGLNYVRGEC